MIGLFPRRKFLHQKLRRTRISCWRSHMDGLNRRSENDGVFAWILNVKKKETILKCISKHTWTDLCIPYARIIWLIVSASECILSANILWDPVYSQAASLNTKFVAFLKKIKSEFSTEYSLAGNFCVFFYVNLHDDSGDDNSSRSTLQTRLIFRTHLTAHLASIIPETTFYSKNI